MEISRNGKKEKECSQRERIEPPEPGGHLCRRQERGKDITKVSGQEAAAAVHPAGEALCQQPRGEDQPETGEGNTVCPGMLRCLLHSHQPGSEPLDNRQQQSGQDECKKEIHPETVYACKSFSSVARIKPTEKDGMRRRVEMLLPEEVGFDSAKDYQQKPAEGQAHVHIPKHRILSEDLAVQQALHENLFQTFHEGHAEEPPLQTQLIRTGEVPEPYGTSPHAVYQNEVKPNIERYNKQLRVHSVPVFLLHRQLPPPHFACLPRAGIPAGIYRTACSASPLHEEALSLPS